jgi:amino-acid N-acetyltransferase
VRTLFLLTTTAEGFFARLGYLHATRDVAPPAIRSTKEFAGICPASSAFMSKQLRDH